MPGHIIGEMETGRDVVLARRRPLDTLAPTGWAPSLLPPTTFRLSLIGVLSDQRETTRRPPVPKSLPPVPALELPAVRINPPMFPAVLPSGPSLRLWHSAGTWGTHPVAALAGHGDT